MAEQIQKKLQGELEKYQQLQKGKRLDYITGEIKRYDQQMQELERRAEQQREVLGRLQQDFQRAQGKAALSLLP
nr:PREDICTED: prefoldin subunit 6 [Apteryx mantelli mantelli]